MRFQRDIDFQKLNLSRDCISDEQTGELGLDLQMLPLMKYQFRNSCAERGPNVFGTQT